MPYLHYSAIKNKDSLESRAIDKDIYFWNSYSKAIRLPIFLSGLGFLADVGYGIGNYLMNNEQVDSQRLITSLKWGLGLLATASSMYLKDQDPKLLDKEPLGKRMHYWTSEKLRSFAPKPVPQPIPYGYSALEIKFNQNLYINL